MILDKALLIKGLGGVAACGGLAYGGTVLVNHYISNANDQKLAELISKVGLTTCTVASPECSIGNLGLNLKQGDDKVEKKTKQNGSTGTEGKIKVYSNNTDYHKGFKFVIEDGDISLADSKKLEQFETYEIKEDGGKWYLTRKNTKSESIKNALGLPDGCTLPTTDNDSSSCNNVSLDSGKLSNLNFKDKDVNGATVASGGSVTLTVSKSSDTEFATEGYKFSFNPTEEVTISTTPSNKIAKNTNTEFKIKKEGNSLSLEKAWTVTSLAQKVGLTCSSTEGNNECSLPTTNNINLYIDSSDKGSKTIKTDSQTKKIKYEENVADHNQGFKFFAEQDIELNGDNSGKKIEKKGDNGPTYEIKKVENEWYLAKKSNEN